ncbi:MAG: type 2 isopentenyl-diphosphate Delta-isomerase [Rhizobacter sp.]|nr:type 2 isopentenyl-diphosphate Delta-isomerase [Chlorobiales bacterium]
MPLKRKHTSQKSNGLGVAETAGSPGARPQPSETASRKQSHIEICLTEPVDFTAQTNGFDSYRYAHNAVPETDFQSLTLNTKFLGHAIAYPVMISSMTGGYGGARFINGALAEVCQSLQIPLGVGSMRQALENKMHRESFSVVRRMAPSIPVYANIGAAEVAKGLTAKEINLLTGLVRADAIIVHLNAAQELFQPEGDTNFRGVLAGLERLTKLTALPVIAKEVGSGISAAAAARLIDAGVRAIDVAGAGGTSWQKVEALRYTEQHGTDERFSDSAMQEFLNWGIPTATCLEQLCELKSERPDTFSEVEIISSGGIKNGIEIAKSISLGAAIAASAKPVLQALMPADKAMNVQTAKTPNHLDAGQVAAEALILQWMRDLRAVMFLTGAASVDELARIPLVPLQKNISNR